MLITYCILARGDEFSAAETDRGLTTGVSIYKKLRAGDSKLPVIIYSTKRQITVELRAIEDPYLTVVCEFEDNSTELIFAAAQKFLS